MRSISLALAAILMLLGSPAAARGEEPKEASPAELLASISIRLAPPEGYPDEQAFTAAIDKKVAELVQAARRARSPQLKAENLLSAVNLMLARSLEPTYSRVVLGAGVAPVPSAFWEKVQDHLASARTAVAEAKDVPDDWARRYRLYGETLEAYAAGLEQLLGQPAASSPAGATSPSGARLALLLEDPDPRVAAAAVLLHSYLAGDGEVDQRLLRLLPPVNAKPDRDALIVGTFIRIRRAELQSRGGGQAAALAMFLQLEERIHDWFGQPQRREEALRAVALAELRVLAAWHDKLGGDDQAARRAWCVKRMQSVIEEWFADGSKEFLRVEQVIPLVVPQLRK